MRAIVLGILTVCGRADAARAQAPVPRGFIMVNGTYHLTSNDFADAAVFEQNAEEARFTTDYEVKGGPAFDVAGGAMVWRRLGIGAGVARFARTTPGALTGAVPHPFFFDRARSVNGSVSGLKREELAVHVQARVVAPVGTRLQVMAFGGPSFFQVTQDMATEFTYDESYPYDVATFTRATTSSAKENKLGFNAGADVAFFFTRQVGVGVEVGYAGTTVSLPNASAGSTDVKIGGVRAGGGLRLRF